MKTSVYIATSLDGFIARGNGDLDWLPSGADAGSNGDYGYGAFMSTVDVVVMGRRTFEKVRTFGEWPFQQQQVVVLSTQVLEVPAELAGRVEWMCGAPADIVTKLAARGLRHAYVDGGQTIQRFLADGLVQRLILTRVPVLLGQGIPLFGALPQDVRLRHLSTHAYESGLVQSEYEVVH